MTNEIEGIAAIKSVAKIEQNHSLNGSQQRLLDKRMTKIPAEEEGKMEEVSALTYVSPLAYKSIIHLQEKRVTYDMIQNLDPNLRVTKGMYMIKYIPKTDKRYKKGRPWMIGQDLIRMGIRVAGPRHFHYLCDRIPELNWLRHNTFYSDELFDIAAMQPGISFWFAIDWVGYAKKLSVQKGPEFGSKQGPSSTPYSIYKCSGEEYRKHYKDKCATLRVLSDVLRDVQEVEELSAVQKEMLANAGETGMTREQYIKGRGGVHQPIDPATGRFVKKNKKED